MLRILCFAAILMILCSLFPVPLLLGSDAPVISPVAPAGEVATPYGWAPNLPIPVAQPGPSYGAPGGYEARLGSPYYYHTPNGGQYVVTGNPYNDHFGPGFHRSQLHGHYRFPYYTYRAPWYYPGRAVYNRDTNMAW